MFGFVKLFVSTMMFFSCNLSNVNPLECVSMNNQECKVRPEIVNVNSNEPVFYSFSIKASKCSGISNNINNPYGKLCVPDVVKNMNIKVFNLMSRNNETRHIRWYKTCKCKCRLDASFVIVNNVGMMMNADMNAKNSLAKEYVIRDLFGIQVIVSVECDKSCDVGEHLDYANCKCRKRLVDKLIEECTENID